MFNLFYSVTTATYASFLSFHTNPLRVYIDQYHGYICLDTKDFLHAYLTLTPCKQWFGRIISQIWICLTGAVEIFSLWHFITVFTCGMPLKETSFSSWSWSVRRTTSAHCPGPKREATWLSAPVTAKFRLVFWWTCHLSSQGRMELKRTASYIAFVHFCFLSCGMLKIRSVYAAWRAIQLELVAWAGMTMFFPGTVASLSII